ncbi:MAG: response regulator [Desulfomonile tiedjei]|nr:response regulator [Desulfomonile tiedjei]
MNKKLRVLLVEDSEDDALLLVRHLRRGGYDPTFRRVETPQDMRAALECETWDVIVSDYSMPLFSASAAMCMVNDTGLDIPFIIVSGTIGEEIAVAAMKAGAHDYIMKDNLKRLIPAIEREVRDALVRQERTCTQKALQESEERYRSLVENLDMGITLIDSNFTIVMTNAARAKMFGCADADPIGHKCHVGFGQENGMCAYCPAVRSMTTGQSAEVDAKITRRDGTTFIARIRAFPTFGDDGTVTGFIEVVDDVTDRKRLEQQLRQAAQMEAIGRLAGGVAHDFNNLLTAMIGYADVLLQQMVKDDPLREKVIQITYAAERAAVLTRQLLAFGRKQVLDVRVMDLNPVIADFEKMLRRVVGEDIELVTLLASELVTVRADRSQIEQILMNLAVNARDAMPRGGAITMETANIVLDEEYAKDHPGVTPGPYVKFSVTDTGSGMDNDTLTRIFDPFFTTKEEGQGTGLGLSTVYGIVKQHQGYIDVQTRMGGGTTFKIYLPACQEPIAAVEEKPVSELQLQGDETVLVVEDEEIVRKVACEVLEILGYRVLDAANPDTAMAVGQQHQGPIHLLLTDVILPRMDGASLYREMNLSRPEMKVLYISGYPESSFLRRRLLKADDDFLQKPFTFETLGTRVREVLDKASSSDSAELPRTQH